MKIEVAMMADALDAIAGMPSYDAALGLTAAQVGSQLDEARRVARAALERFQRAGGMKAVK